MHAHSPIPVPANAAADQEVSASLRQSTAGFNTGFSADPARSLRRRSVYRLVINVVASEIQACSVVYEVALMFWVGQKELH